MSMSHTDFTSLANAFRITRPVLNGIGSKAQWAQDVFAIADVLEASHPGFNRERWLYYINLERGSS